MSSGIQIAGSGPPVRAFLKSSTTGTVAIYTVPTASAGVQAVGMFQTNVDGTNAVDVTVEVYDLAGTTAYKIQSTWSLAADTTYWLDMHGVMLLPGDEVRITAGAANDLESIFVGVDLGSRG